MNLEKLYQQTILEYSSRKDLKREIESPTYIERGHNPNCGDDLTLEIKLNSDNIIEDAAFLGNGCAISSASTAMLIDLIKGKSIEEAKEKVDIFFESAAGILKIVSNGIATDYSEDFATKILSEDEVTIIADVKTGSEEATAWGCDLTHEYIDINADYRS